MPNPFDELEARIFVLEQQIYALDEFFHYASLHCGALALYVPFVVDPVLHPEPQQSPSTGW